MKAITHHEAINGRLTLLGRHEWVPIEETLPLRRKEISCAWIISYSSKPRCPGLLTVLWDTDGSQPWPRPT